MPKKSRKSGQKKASKRGAGNSPVNFAANFASKELPRDDERRVVASRWGTILSVLAVGILICLYYATQPETCATWTRSGPVPRMLPKLLSADLTTDAEFARICQRVHDTTGAFFFLSGKTYPTKIHLQKGFSGVVSQASRFIGRKTNDASSSVLSETYTKDSRDMLFAITWGIVLLAIRGILMPTLLLPAARRFVKRPSSEKLSSPHQQRKYRRNIERFAEQSWVFFLYSTSLALILTVARRQPFWPYNLDGLWQGYPHTNLNGLTKAVYLWEASNYIHQLFVINLEARRSDYLQMTVHHLVTLCLIGGSYVCNFWRVGLAIVLLMDPSDVLLAVRYLMMLTQIAKMLKYMGWQKTCDAMFGAFMITWTLTRHVGYCFVWMSCIYDAPRLIAYRSPIDPNSGYLFNATIYGTFVILLGILQCILLVWFSMILKVTYRVLIQAGAIDSRSDEDSN